MKLVMATLSTAALLALAGIAPSAQAQDQNPKQQQDKEHPAKPSQQHPQEQQRPAHPQTSRPAQQQQRQQEQRPTQRPTEQPRQEPSRQEQPSRTPQRRQERAQQQQQKTQQKQQRAQQKETQKTQQRTASRAHPQPGRTQRAQQTPAARGGQPERGHPQQTAHYEQAHFHRYSAQRGERMVRIPDPQFREHFGREHRFYIGAPVMVGGFPRFQYGGFWFVLEEPWPGYWAYGNDYYIMFTDGNYWLCDYDDPGVQIQVAVIAG